MLLNVTIFYIQNAMLNNCLILKTLQIGKYSDIIIHNIIRYQNEYVSLELLLYFFNKYILRG